MGRTGLRAVLRWCLCFCAALATASIPVASAQTHAPKISPPPQNSALSPAKETPPPKISSPEDSSNGTSARSAEPVAEPSAEPVIASEPKPPAVPPAEPAAEPATKPAAIPSAERLPLSATEPPAAPSVVSPIAPPIGPNAGFTPSDGLPLAGERGVTHPVCLQCPPALYSYPAMMKRVQGNVTMDAIISKDGYASDVKILGSLGSGLDEQAMKAVRTWQWNPAQDANGNPVVAHQTVVITFRLPK
jgi:TonB family protein